MVVKVTETADVPVLENSAQFIWSLLFVLINTGVEAVVEAAITVVLPTGLIPIEVVMNFPLLQDS